MANPLKELDLAVKGFQTIQELPIEAAPAKVWAALVNPNSWFGFNPDRTMWPKSTLELWPGGRWFAENKDGASLMGMVTHIEPQKLLRLSGPMGKSHLPVTNVFIFELQPAKDGKATLLRLGQSHPGQH